MSESRKCVRDDIQDVILRRVRSHLSKSFDTVVSRRQFVCTSISIQQLMTLAKAYLQQHIRTLLK